MVIHELTDAECRDFIARTNIGRLACARNNQPYVVPIRVDLDGQFLYSYATLGQKVEWMRENPLVCVLIDELHSPWQWVSVVVFGHYEELPKASWFERPRNIAERLFQTHASWWEPAAVPIAGQAQRPSIVFRIQIIGMSGRRTERVTPKPEAVTANVRRTSSWWARWHCVTRLSDK